MCHHNKDESTITNETIEAIRAIDDELTIKSTLINHMYQRIKKWDTFQEMISTLQESPNDYTAIHIKTVPYNDPAYESAIDKPTRWTFCFLNVRKFKNDIFFFFSDHNDGVYKRVCVDNVYYITYSTICIYGSNKLKKDEIIACEVNSNIKYSQVDWLSGKFINKQKDITKKKRLKAKINIDFKKIIDLMIEHNYISCSISGSLLLQDLLIKRGIKAELINGFIIIDNMYCTKHVWLTVNNNIFDVALQTLLILNPTMKTLNYTHSNTLPEGIKRIDNETFEDCSQLIELEICIMLAKAGTYWKSKNIPTWLLDFHALS
jgi:hypothetical protein